MKRDRRFWWIVILIAAVHGALVLSVARWAKAARAPDAQSITWLSGGGAADSVPAAEETDESSSPLGSTASPANETAPAQAKSEIVLPTATPIPPLAALTPRRPSPSSTPRAKRTPKTSPSVRASPRKKPSSRPANASAQRTASKSELGKEKNKSPVSTAKIQDNGKRSGGAGEGSGSGTGRAAKASEFNSYGNMLHDRFYNEWVQPTTVVASGAKFTTRARVRIARDGTVSQFSISQPSGNVLVDESVAAAGARVKKVDALPPSLTSKEYFEVEVNFALNSE